MTTVRQPKIYSALFAWYLSLAGNSLAQVQDEFRFSFTGDSLTVEQRQIIAEALDSDGEFTIISTAVLSPEAPENTLDKSNLDELERLFRNARSNPTADAGSFYIANQNGQSFAVIDRASEMATRLGISALNSSESVLGGGIEIDVEDTSIFESSPVPTPELSQAWALPLKDSEVRSLGLEPLPNNPHQIRIAPEVVHIERTGVDDILARIEEDLRHFGTASIRIPLTDFSAAKIAETKEAFENSGANSARLIEPIDVAQDLPEDFELLGAHDGRCGASEDWPFSLDSFRSVMQHNEKALELVGVSSPSRARVLIVDSGLSIALAQHEKFRTFLKPDMTHALRQGFYWRGQTSQDAKVICDLNLNGSVGVSPYGIVTSPKNRDTCNALEVFGGLEPVKTAQLPPQYAPDHGGVVGVLAAGGPKLIEADLGLHRYLGIGFARINSVESGKIRARDEDVADAINYAIRLDYNVVNMSLAFKYENDSSAKTRIGCFVNPASSNACIGRTNRLIIAAAGNNSQMIQQSGSSFPYEVVSTRRRSGSNQILIVGGVEQDEAGKTIPWEKSTYHEQLVDILAPSVGVVSLDGEAKPVCMNGTSVAAPQVSFVAGLLFSLGYTEAAEVRERILATAVFSEANDPLFKRALNGGVLDPVAAIDVFSDLVWVKDDNGSETMKRGMLVAQQNDLKGVVLPICKASSPGLRGEGGLRDVSRFALWRSHGEDVAEVWDPEFFVTADQKCHFDPNERIRFIEYGQDNRIDEYPLRSVARIVPSHFRRALEFYTEQQ